jgi:hypothetical protein
VKTPRDPRRFFLMQGVPISLFCLAALAFLASCTSMPPRPVPVTSFPRQDASTPYQVLHMFHADTDAVRAQMEMQDDHAVSYRRMRRMGDGSLSVGLRHEKGEWFRAQECSGMLFLEGRPGQKYYLEVRNETNAPLEIAVGGSGQDWLSDGTFSISNAGFLLRPLETRRIPAPDTLAPLPPPHAPLTLFRLDEKPGVITLAVYRLKDHWPWEAAPPPSEYPNTKYPQRQRPPMPLPHGYF